MNQIKNLKYFFFASLLVGFTACADGNDQDPPVGTNEAIETPSQPLADTNTENEESLPADADVVADDMANLDNPPVPEDATTVGGSVTSPAPDQEQRLDQYYARFSDKDKITGNDGTPTDDDGDDDEEVNYLYEYDDTPSPKSKAGDYDITYYKNDGAFYQDKTKSSSSSIKNYKPDPATPNPTKLVNGERVPIQKMGDAPGEPEAEARTATQNGGDQ